MAAFSVSRSEDASRIRQRVEIGSPKCMWGQLWGNGVHGKSYREKMSDLHKDCVSNTRYPKRLMPHLPLLIRHVCNHCLRTRSFFPSLRIMILSPSYPFSFLSLSLVSEPTHFHPLNKDCWIKISSRSRASPEAQDKTQFPISLKSCLCGHTQNSQTQTPSPSGKR